MSTIPCLHVRLKDSASVAILAAGMSFLVPQANAGSLPGHGRFVAGQGGIARSGGRMTVDQATRTGIVDWKSFSIGARDSVMFENGHGATLNIVGGRDPSRIAGDLHATGSVYLLNRAGVAVTATGRVDTQGDFAASSLWAGRDAFSASGRLRLGGRSKGNVVDAGQIAARNVRLIAGGTARVPGQVSAARNVETSGARVRIGGATISAKNWLIDPKNLTVTSSAATTIENSLNNGNNVTLKTTATTASGPGTQSNGAGDVIVNAPIAWSGTGVLTLQGYHSVDINRAINVQGHGGLQIGGPAWQFSDLGVVNFAFGSSLLKINGVTFALKQSLNSLINAIKADPSGNFALANNVNAATLGTLSHAAINTAFSGFFEGLGHTVSNLKIRDTTAYVGDNVGLFRELDGGGQIEDVRMAAVDIKVTEGTQTGALVGYSHGGSVINSSSAGTVIAGAGSAVGGLVGLDDGIITGSSSSATVRSGADSRVGGLAGGVGGGSGAITDSDATGNVTDNGSGAEIGGLVGSDTNNVTSSYATGAVTALGSESDAGGLVGWEKAIVKKCYATGAVTAGSSGSVGGLIGTMAAGSILSSHAKGNVTAGDDAEIGGLAGRTYLVKNSFATGSVTAGNSDEVGGLTGNGDGQITNAQAAGAVSAGADSTVGGLVGQANYDVSNSHASGAVSAGGASNVGGLAGESSLSLTADHATGAVSVTNYGGVVGGLVGLNEGTITSSYATSKVSYSGDGSDAGGLVGDSEDTITLSYATGNVTGAAHTGMADAGGLVGHNGATISQSFATGAVKGGDKSDLGGLVGNNVSVINEDYARGAVTGGTDDGVGGLAGANSGNISYVYSTGKVTGGFGSGVGGLIGFDDVGFTTLTDTYWDQTTSGITDATRGAGNAPSDPGITGLTSTQLKAALPTGFSATDWSQASGTNGGFPFLTNNPPP